MFYNKNDISEILVLQNLLVPGIIVLGLNIWTTNDNALYTSGLGLANITGLPKKALVLFNGILGTILAVWLYNNFCGWLSMLNTTIPPVGALLIADFILNRGKGERAASILRWQAVVSWAIGVAVANFVKFGISSINGMIAAVIAYVILSACCCGKCGCQCGCQGKAN
jgi:cytosine permease